MRNLLKSFRNVKNLNLLLSLFLLMGFVTAGNSQTSVAPSGSGTSGDPYQIANLNNLYWLTQTTAAWASGKYFIQTADIDASSTTTWASGAGFSPIGNLTNRFYGNYDGNYKTISNLYISRSGDQIGLFGFAQSGTIQKLIITNATINATNINAAYGVGILMGSGYLGTISNITIIGGTITGYGNNAFIGAIIGRSQQKFIINCKSSANITHSYSSNINSEIGGVIGYLYGDSVLYCSSTGNITASNNTSRVGGFAGSIVKSGALGSVSYCYASGNVSCVGGAGGFVGNIYNVIATDCYATGNVSITSSQAGGFASFSQSGSNFMRCYSKGLVSGSSWAGGFCGYAENPLSTSSYWDTQTSGKSSAFGYLYGSVGGGGTLTGKTTAEMKTQATFSGWDFTNVWDMNSSYNSGYPILRAITYDTDPNMWTGTVSTDWNTAGNWSFGTVPTSTTNVIIPNVTNKPIIGIGFTGSTKNITVHTGSSITVNGTLEISGNVTNSGTITSATGTVTFNGSSSQTIVGLSGNFNTLNINNSSSVTLASNVTVTNSLTLTSGLLILSSYNLTLGASASIAGSPSASNMIIANGTGELRKTFTGTGSFTYPVGDNTGTVEYSPITLNFTSGSFSSAYAGITLGNSKYVNNSSPVDYINRYWTVTQSGISGFTCDVTAQYLAADVAGTEANIYCGKYDAGSGWMLLNQANTVNHTLSGTVSGFSSFTGGQQSSMPVTLLSLNSSVINRDVVLKWTTSTETNNAGFEIQRLSSDNQTSGWINAGFVKGNGTKNSISEYGFTDSKLSKGKYQYRLKQIDNNGNFEYHNLNSIIEIGTPSKYSLSQNYPNPFNPSTKIEFSIPLDTKVTLCVYDLTGRRIATLINNEIKKADFYSVDFNAANLSTGVYFYRISTDKFTDTKKMILIK